MPKLAANLSTMFTQLPLAARYAAAAAAGFAAVECQFPYEVPAEELRASLDQLGLQQVLLNTSPGQSGERGLAALPGRQQQFREAMEQALHYAQVLRCPRIHVMAGVKPADATLAQCLEQYLGNLEWAARRCAAVGVTALIEPINTRVDVPGYVLDSTALAVQCLQQVGSTHLKLQYDVYHMQIMEGDLARSIERLLPVIGHMQIADNPGRHEPGTGEINYPWLLRHIDALGYDGYIGCEYLPLADTLAGLSWARDLLPRRH
jgi:hydroxypyruvate isomerase